MAASSGIFVRRLVDALSREANITVLCPADSGKREVTEAATGYVLDSFAYGPKLWQVLAQVPGGIMPALRRRPLLAALLPLLLGTMTWRILRHAARNDVVHANWAICGALASLALMLRPRPLVVTLRGDDVTLAQRSRLQKIVLDIVMRRATRIVCVAESMRLALGRLYPESLSRSCVVLNGVDDEFLQLRPPSSHSGSIVELVAVGSLIERKGYDLLLAALAKMESRSWRLTIIGEGFEQQSLEALARRLGLVDMVRFAGAVEPAQMPEKIGASDVFVLPSRSEGRPNVVLEAMAAMRPVVAFAIPGVTDLVDAGREGWLAEPGNVDELADALEEAIANGEERMQRGRAARERVVRSDWTWAAAAAGYLDIYAQALSHTSQRRH